MILLFSLCCVQTVARGDSVEVKYTGWIFENNTCGKVSENLSCTRPTQWHVQSWLSSFQRGVPMYTEVSSFQVGGSAVYRGVLISRGWNRGVPLYTEVSSFQGVGIEEFRCIQGCPLFRGLE